MSSSRETFIHQVAIKDNLKRESIIIENCQLPGGCAKSRGRAGFMNVAGDFNGEFAPTLSLSTVVIGVTAEICPVGTVI